MAIPPWTIELLRRGITDVARKASQPETLAKIKTQATEILQELPDTAARGIDAMMRSAEAGKSAVQRWSRKHTALAIPMLNASGVLLHQWGSGVAVSDSVTQVGGEFIRGDVIDSPQVEQRLSRRLAKLLPAGDEHSIALTSNFAAALTAFSSLVESTPLVIHRHHAVRMPGGLPLPEAFGTYLPVIQEVGAVGHVATADFDGLESFCAVIADGGQRPVELLDLGQREFLQAVVLPVATLAASSHDSIPSAESMLTQGADFVIMPGDGLAGGPPCGLIVGRQEGIEQIKGSPTWPALAAGSATMAMMTVALESAGSHTDPLPIGQLLQVSEENLRGRAERMAIRLGGSDSIVSCQVTAEDARLTAEGRWRFPSRQLRVRHANRSATDWAEMLREDLPAVIAVVDGEDLRVDFRWIAAADDNRLAEALGSGPAGGEGETGS